MEFSHRKNYYVPGLETLFGEQALRLNATVEREESPAFSKYQKLVVVVPPNMKISQLKRKLENEFEEQYPNERGLQVDIVEDISGLPLRDTALVGDHLRQDDRIFVYPKTVNTQGAFDTFPNIIESKDLITTIKQAHYSVVTQLTNSQLEEYQNKAGVIEGIIGLGLSNDKAVNQNLGIVLTKLITEKNVLQIYDEERHLSLLNLTVMVIDGWIQKYAMHDNLILGNIIRLMEVLVKSRAFYNKLKDRPCMDVLIKVSRDDSQPIATKNALLRITSALSPTLTWSTGKYFQTPSYAKGKSLLLSASQQISSGGLGKSGSSSALFLDSPMYKKSQQQRFVPLEQNLYKSAQDPFNRSPPLLNSGRLLTPSRYGSGIQSSNNIEETIYSNSLSRQGNDPEFQRKWLYDRPLYKLSFKDRQPPVDFRSQDLLTEYLELIHIETTPKDHVTYALHHIELMLVYAVIKIMNDRTKFLSIIQLFQYTDLPFTAQESQLKIIGALTNSMNRERAYDFQKADGVERIIFAYRYYHPKMRPVVAKFIDQVFIHGRKYLEIQKMINFTQCEHDPIKESAMKVRTVLKLNQQQALCHMSERKQRFEMTNKMQMHIPYLIECAGSTKDSLDFTNLALQTIANLARKDQMRIYILYNEGLKLFVDKLRDLGNMTGRRIAAEAMTNVAEKDEYLRSRIMGEIRDELKRSWRNEIDPVVNLHLKGFLRNSGEKGALIYQ